LVGGGPARYLLSSQRVANARFKEKTGWAPKYRSAREGWQQIVLELRGQEKQATSPGAATGLVRKVRVQFLRVERRRSRRVEHERLVARVFDCVCGSGRQVDERAV